MEGEPGLREIAFRMTDEQLESYKPIIDDLQILDSGSVEMSMEQARSIRTAFRAWWSKMYDNHPELFEDDEIYEVDTVRGIVFVEKE